MAVVVAEMVKHDGDSKGCEGQQKERETRKEVRKKNCADPAVSFNLTLF